MRLPTILTCLLLSAPVCLPATVSYTGTAGSDDFESFFQVRVTTAGIVEARTWSFAGGVNAAGAVIPDGGFAPVLSLFEMSGMQLLIAQDYAGGSGGCGPRAVDPTSGACWDAYLSVFLDVGDYILALTQDDNLPIGPTLADGFARRGQGNFTGPAFLGSPASFTLITGQQRTADWALDITADGSQAMPEPSIWLLTVSGLSMVFLRRRSKA